MAATEVPEAPPTDEPSTAGGDRRPHRRVRFVPDLDAEINDDVEVRRG